jgi:hypothetical protein
LEDEVMLHDVKPRLQQLVWSGRTALQNVEAATSPATNVVRRGVRQAARSGGMFVSLLADAALSQGAWNLRAQHASACEAWASQVTETLTAISIAKPGMRFTGNSSALVRQFSATRKAALPATKYRKGIAMLESLLVQELVANSEISEWIKQHRARERQERSQALSARVLRIPSMGEGVPAVTFPTPEALRARLWGFEHEADLLVGAIDTFCGDSAIRHRQTIMTARVALESMCLKLTGRREGWKAVIAERLSKHMAKVIAAAYSFLSEFGSHAGRHPSETEAEVALHHAIGLVVHLADERARFGSNPSGGAV